MTVEFDKTSKICETFVYVWTVERDENVKRDQTIEFVTLFNMWDCWMRLDCGIGWEKWICETFE